MALYKLKKWTRKFFRGLKKPSKNYRYGTFANAARAQEKLGIPSELWLELSKNAEEIHGDWRVDRTSEFMAGVAVGWVEAGKKATDGLDEQKS